MQSLHTVALAVISAAALVHLNAAPAVHVDGQRTQHGFKLSWNSEQEVAYRIEKNSSLIAPFLWQDVSGPLIAEASAMAWTDQPGHQQSFYRIRLDPTWVRWTNQALLPEIRSRLLLRELTLDEKISMVHGVLVERSYVGNMAGIARLGIPALHLQDGPAGVADGAFNVTALPAPILLASCWNEELAREYGALAGKEARGKGVHVLLGPMINMVRVPQAGRNFETYGEDPYLAARITAANVLGIQSQQVISTPKHFIANDQETSRGSGNSVVDERALREIYYPPFLASVRAGAGALCSAYNRINGDWSSESLLLKDLLKAEWGFKGFVVCDWGASFGTQSAAMNGLDLEMHLGTRFGESLKTAVLNGTVPQTQLDKMAGRVLASMFRHGIIDNTPTGTLSSVVFNTEHAMKARQIAEQGIVLLKNSRGLLPLAQVNSIAVSGDVAHDHPIWTGTGSAQVFFIAYYDSPRDAIARRAGAGTSVSYHNGSDLNQARQAAAAANVAIVCVGEQTGEGTDRTGLMLPPDQDALVQAISEVNTNTIVVLYAGAGTLMPWINNVAAVVSAWYPGIEGAHALASILWGDVNPSGKLPITFPASASQVPTSAPWQFPGTNLVVNYTESIFMGYRWYDETSATPLFPFGHGLSYTAFNYSNLAVGSVSPAGEVPVQFELRNTGTRFGTEIAQLYLALPESAGGPPRELKAFKRVNLQPGESKLVTMKLRWEDLCYWNTSSYAWTVPTGTFQVVVGSSSRDLRLTNSFVFSTSIPISGMKNLALFQTVTAPGNAPSAVADGDPSTVWVTPASGPSELRVDLGSITEINRLRFLWGPNYAPEYSIQISEDNNAWSLLHNQSNGISGLKEALVAGSGRYLRLQIPGGARELAELEVFGPITNEEEPPVTNHLDFVWVDDSLPAGATAAGDFGDFWQWTGGNPTPFCGSLAHPSVLASGLHQHYFINASATMSVATGDTLYCYAFLDPANPPTEVMVQWNDGSWEHRAYWGANQITYGTDGTASRRYMGLLPPTGQWVKLSVPASLVNLEGRAVSGMCFSVYGGRITWDCAGKTAPAP